MVRTSIQAAIVVLVVRSCLWAVVRAAASQHPAALNPAFLGPLSDLQPVIGKRLLCNAHIEQKGLGGDTLRAG